MGYRLNRLDEPVFMAVPKPLQTEFGIHYRLESCALLRTGFNFSLPSYGLGTLLEGMRLEHDLAAGEKQAVSTKCVSDYTSYKVS